MTIQCHDTYIYIYIYIYSELGRIGESAGRVAGSGAVVVVMMVVVRVMVGWHINIFFIYIYRSHQILQCCSVAVLQIFF